MGCRNAPRSGDWVGPTDIDQQPRHEPPPASPTDPGAGDRTADPDGSPGRRARTADPDAELGRPVRTPSPDSRPGRQVPTAGPDSWPGRRDLALRRPRASSSGQRVRCRGDPVLRQLRLAAVGGREDQRALLRQRHRVLPVRGPGPVGRDDGPVVFKHLGLRGAQGHHRLDGQAEAGDQLRPFPRRFST